MITKQRATIEDLYRVDGKAELVNGEIVHMPPTGDDPSSSGGAIYVSLWNYMVRTRSGRAYTDNVAFRCNLPHRQSFSPDAAYYTGPRSGMRFLDEPPDFAVEVRSAGDYGPVAESEMPEKRADYFAAGTKVVWDVDLRGPETIRSYRFDSQGQPDVFRRGDTADAEPAVPGWRFPVDDLFI